MRDLAIIQTAASLALCLWLATGRPPGRADLWMRAAGAWLAFAGMALAGIWLALPLSAALLLGALMLTATVAGAWRLDRYPRPPGRLRTWAGRMSAMLAAGFGLWLVVPAIAGSRVPAGAVELQFPMRGGRYIVANGGSSERVNAHLMTLDPRFAKWRGQSYAVDLIRIDRLGFRTRDRRLLAMPRDPAAYLTFGEPVYAPCAGSVLAAESGRPDMQVPERDRRHLEGNFVLIDCGRAQILLGHFRKGDVRVAPGQWVETGQLLGKAGNSGNSDEPHLHIHAQTAGTGESPFAGQPQFATYDGRFLVRNMIVVQPESERRRP